MRWRQAKKKLKSKEAEFTGHTEPPEGYTIQEEAVGEWNWYGLEHHPHACGDTETEAEALKECWADYEGFLASNKYSWRHLTRYPAKVRGKPSSVNLRRKAKKYVKNITENL